MSAFVDYTTPINDRWTLRSGFDVQYVDERQDEFDPTRADFLPSYTVGNARVTIENDTWSFDLFVDNLWDERAVFSQVAWPFGLDPVTRTTINRPRTMGLRTTFRY